MGCWIKYQLNLRNLNFEAVAQKANVDASMISHFLRGRKKSDKVKKALAEILGYKSFDALIAASKKEAV
jgi:transcriptional regulator with XRE-family HTH domain